VNRGIVFAALMLVGCSNAPIQHEPTVLQVRPMVPDILDEYLAKDKGASCKGKICAVSVCYSQPGNPTVIFRRYYSDTKITIVVSTVDCFAASLKSSQKS